MAVLNHSVFSRGRIPAGAGSNFLAGGNCGQLDTCGLRFLLTNKLPILCTEQNKFQKFTQY